MAVDEVGIPQFGDAESWALARYSRRRIAPLLFSVASAWEAYSVITTTEMPHEFIDHTGLRMRRFAVAAT